MTNQISTDELRDAISKLPLSEKLLLMEGLLKSIGAGNAKRLLAETGVREQSLQYASGDGFNETGEANMEQLDRITQHPGVMGGKACIRGMRVTVGMVVNQIAAGHTIEQVLGDYPYLEKEDIMQALRYAAWRLEEREVVLSVG